MSFAFLATKQAAWHCLMGWEWLRQSARQYWSCKICKWLRYLGHPWPLSLVSLWQPVHLQAGLSKDAAEIVSKMQAWDASSDASWRLRSPRSHCPLTPPWFSRFSFSTSWDAFRPWRQALWNRYKASACYIIGTWGTYTIVHIYPNLRWV